MWPGGPKNLFMEFDKKTFISSFDTSEFWDAGLHFDVSHGGFNAPCAYFYLDGMSGEGSLQMAAQNADMSSNFSFQGNPGNFGIFASTTSFNSSLTADMDKIALQSTKRSDIHSPLIWFTNKNLWDPPPVNPGVYFDFDSIFFREVTEFEGTTLLFDNFVKILSPNLNSSIELRDDYAILYANMYSNLKCSGTSVEIVGNIQAPNESFRHRLGAMSMIGTSLNGMQFGNTQTASMINASIVLGTTRENGSWSLWDAQYSGGVDNVALTIDGFGYGGDGATQITGDNNVLIGKWTGYNLISGGADIYIGKSAGERNPAGWNNISIGENAGTRPSGHYNIDIGYQAGYNYDCADSDSKNINIGHYAGKSYQDATHSWATNSTINIGEGAGTNSNQDTSINIGYFAGNNVNFEAYKRNINIGHRAGDGMKGSWNFNLGAYAGMTSVGDSNVFIGNEVGYLWTGNNAVVLDGMYRIPGDYLFLGNSLNRTIEMNGTLTMKKAATFQETVTFDKVIKLTPLPSPPGTPTLGMHYCSTDTHLYYYNGTAWVQLD